MSLRHPYRIAGLLALFLAACLTVNVYFYPSKEVDQTAKKIIEDIRGAAMEEATGEEAPDEEGSNDKRSRGWGLVAPAYAAGQETMVSNPVIDSIKAKLKNRAGTIAPYFQSGAIGEGNNALVLIRDISVLPMRDRAKLNPLVKEENDDREKLYKEVAKELGVKDKDLPQVRKSFANEWQKTALPGWWIQLKNGNWKQVP